jgi:phenylacetate-coenzyme A ligase PaaK-like adenylate-forming protein
MFFPWPRQEESVMDAIATDIETLRARVGAELAAQIPEHLERLRRSAERLAAHQRERLRVLLQHAREHSPFHARRLAAVDPDRFEPGDLAYLPTMNKTEMMASFDEVVTDRSLSLRQAEDHLSKSTSEPKLLLDEYVCLASGGSSGLRGVFVNSLAEFAALGAAIMRPAIARQRAMGTMSGSGARRFVALE